MIPFKKPGMQGAESCLCWPCSSSAFCMPAPRLQSQAGTQLMLVSPEQERSLGLKRCIIPQTGYDSRGAIGFWERLSKGKSASSPPSFLSTHPTDYDRIAKIRSLLPEALGYYAN
jgi:Zn-dependent protease with chaperone function